MNDMKMGSGTYRGVNGDTYVGDWVNDFRHGRGKITYSNGDNYEGDWVDDTKEGQGVEIFIADGLSLIHISEPTRPY